MNTIDTIAPVSKIESYDYNPNTGEIQLNLSGSDNLSGVEFYTIYVSKNDSAFIPVMRTTEKSLVYKAIENLEYRLYSLATDNTGHIESTPVVEDISFKITNTLKLKENDYKVFPNPATEELFIQTSFEGLKQIEIISTEGKKVYTKTKNGNLIKINTIGLNKGIYILKISDNKSTVVRKVLIN